MHIGRAATASGVSAKMIRYYESIDLIRPRGRTEGGYRIYAGTDIHVLRFVCNARDLGFPIGAIRQLLGLWRDRKRASAEVKALALQQIRELDVRLEELRAMRDTLAYLADHCAGDDRPDCPILEGLSRSGGPASVEPISNTGSDTESRVRLAAANGKDIQNLESCIPVIVARR